MPGGRQGRLCKVVLDLEKSRWYAEYPTPASADPRALPAACRTKTRSRSWRATGDSPETALGHVLDWAWDKHRALGNLEEAPQAVQRRALWHLVPEHL